MIVNGRRLGALCGAAVLAATTLTGCGSQTAGGRTTITVWSQDADTTSMAILGKISKYIEKKMPNVKINLVRKPSMGGNGDNTELITGVRGDVSPDLMLTDRFGISQQAATGMLRSLTPFIKKDEKAGQGDLRKKYLKFAIGEATYNKQLWGMPMSTDSRGLIYNKKVLKDAGVDMSLFDPKNGPMTIAQMMEQAKKINRKDKHGNYTRMGIIPWDDQASITTWEMGYGAKFFDNKTCQVSIGEPAMRKTLDDYARWAKELGYTKTQNFLDTYRPKNAPPTMNPLFQNRLGMTISGNWNIQGYRQNAPKMDWGVTYLPVPKAGDKPYTWSGGPGWVMPENAPHPDLAWKVMKLFTGKEGQLLWAKGAIVLPTYKSLLKDPSVTKHQEFFAKELKFAQSREPLPVHGFLWDAETNAQQAVTMGEQTPKEAQTYLNDRMKSQMDNYCPFTAPPLTKGY